MHKTNERRQPSGSEVKRTSKQEQKRANDEEIVHTLDPVIQRVAGRGGRQGIHEDAKACDHDTGSEAKQPPMVAEEIEEAGDNQFEGEQEAAELEAGEAEEEEEAPENRMRQCSEDRSGVDQKSMLDQVICVALEILAIQDCERTRCKVEHGSNEKHLYQDIQMNA